MFKLLFLASMAFAGDDLNHFTMSCSTSAAPLQTTATKAEKFIIQNPSSNTAAVFIGNSTVATSGSARGLQVDIGDTLSIESSKHQGGNQLLSTAQVYCVAASSQTIVIGYVKRN